MPRVISQYVLETELSSVYLSHRNTRVEGAILPIILTYGHHKDILEIKESLLIKRDRPLLNKNISSAKLFLFDNN